MQPQQGIGRRIAQQDLERTIRRLSEPGSGKEDLITLYIPPARTIAEVTAYLEQEQDRRSSIAGGYRSGSESPPIPEARAMLRKIGKIPENGLAIFCRPGEDSCEAIEPPVPVTDFLIRISSRFYVEPLLRMRTEGEFMGLILIDLDQAFWALSRNGEPGRISRIESNVPAKHHKGGQSAARFQRLREIAAHEFYTRVGELAGEGLLAGTGNGERLAGLMVGGQIAAATELATGSFLPAAIRQKITGVVEAAAISPDGIRVLAKRGEERIRERKAAGELRVLDDFLAEYARNRGGAVSGESAVRDHLTEGLVKTLLLAASLRQSGAAITCSICGHTAERTIRLGEGETVSDILAHTCRVCNGPVVEDAGVDLVEDMGRLAIRSGAGTVIVPDETEAGKRFIRENGGIGAILRYRTEW